MAFLNPAKYSSEHVLLYVRDVDAGLTGAHGEEIHWNFLKG